MDAEHATWGAAVVTALSLAATFVSAYFARASARDKMQFDAKTLKMEGQIEAQGASIKACDDERKQLAEKVQTAERRAADCQEQHQTAEIDRKQLRDRLGTLEGVVAKLGGQMGTS